MYRLLDRMPARPAKGRWDIQGLRAFAVLAVVVDHLTHWPGGGFIGVDVFFVISGFLITGLLISEHERNRGISFANFYRRRVRRIIPAAVIVLTATVIASYFALNAARAASIRTDSIWALLFGANWRFLSASTDYFNADGPVSPLQHFWSLSIEEQFYFVWPILMVGIFAALLRGRWTHKAARSVVFAAIASISVASFAWALFETSRNPTGAYFSTLTRIWELGVGAMLAVAMPVLMRIPDAVRPVMSWVGLSGMIASLWVVSGDSGFPAPSAALPVACAALVIAGGTFGDRTEQQRFVAPLTNRVAGYIGDISYSLYLWHFPMIVIGFLLYGDSAVSRWAILGAIAVVSVLSYELIESPIRESGWLLPLHRAVPGSSWRSRAARRRRWRKEKAQFDLLTPRYNTFLAVGVVALVIALWFAAFNVSSQPPPTSALGSDSPSEGAAEARDGKAQAPEQRALNLEIVQALKDTSWPSNLTPSMDEALQQSSVSDQGELCGDYDNTVDPASCSFGDSTPKHRAILVGDSIAMAYLETLGGVVSQQPGWQITSYGTFDCAFTTTTIETSSNSNEQCDRRKQDAVDAIKDVRPDVLIVSSVYSLGFPVGDDVRMTGADWQKSTQQLLDKVRGSYGKVVFLAAPPAEVDPTECFTRASAPVDCTGGIPELWQEKALAEQALAKANGGLWVDSEAWFCAVGKCPPYVGKTPVKVDQVHMTLAYQRKIIPAVAEKLRAERVWVARLRQ